MVFLCNAMMTERFFFFKQQLGGGGQTKLTLRTKTILPQVRRHSCHNVCRLGRSLIKRSKHILIIHSPCSTLRIGYKRLCYDKLHARGRRSACGPLSGRGQLSTLIQCVMQILNGVFGHSVSGIVISYGGK